MASNRPQGTGRRFDPTPVHLKVEGSIPGTLCLPPRTQYTRLPNDAVESCMPKTRDGSSPIFFVVGGFPTHIHLCPPFYTFPYLNTLKELGRGFPREVVLRSDTDNSVGNKFLTNFGGDTRLATEEVCDGPQRFINSPGEGRIHSDPAASPSFPGRPPTRSSSPMAWTSSSSWRRCSRPGRRSQTGQQSISGVRCIQTRCGQFFYINVDLEKI